MSIIHAVPNPLPGLLACGLLAATSGVSYGEAATTKPARLNVAAVQIIADPVGGPVAQVIHYMERAAGDEADLIVFPEYHLGHIPVPGEATEKIGAAAAEQRMNVVVGCIEVEPDGTYYNTALLFDRRGVLAGKYRKTHAAVGEPPYFWPAKGDELEAGMVVGDTLPVFDLDFGCVGIFTCYDGYFPEVPNTLSLQGAEVLIWINGRAGSVEEFMVRTMTYQTYTAIVATNTAHGHGTTIAQYPATILAVAPTPETDYITATIDLDSLRTSRLNSRVFHQRRPELYAPLARPWEPWRAYESEAESGTYTNGRP